MDPKPLIRLAWVVCVLGFVLSSLASAQVIFQETFETQGDNELEAWIEHGGCRPHSFKVVQDPCSDNIDNKVVQITNIMGQDNRSCRDTPWKNPVSKNPLAYTHRSELIPRDKIMRAKPEEDFWVGMRTFVAKNYPTGTNLINFHVTQIVPKVNEGLDMSLQINPKGKWVFSIRKTLVGVKPNHHHEFFGDIDRGKWTNWVFHYKRSTRNNGVVEVWKDEKRVVNYKGVTSQSDVVEGLWKLGLYRGAPVKPNHFGETYMIYFDDVKIAKGSNQYEAVRPDMAASQCLPQPQPPKNLSVQEQN